MATSTQKQKDDQAVWHVRNEQGEKFGPVDFATLKAWAADGRLAPANEVSDNGKVWRLASLQPGLEMDWVAEVTPGTFYGPIHRGAMEELAREGSLTGQAAFFVRAVLGDARNQDSSALHDRNAEEDYTAQLEEGRNKVSELGRQLAAMQKKLEVCEGHLSQARCERDQRAQALDAAKAECKVQAAMVADQAQRFNAERQALQSAVRRSEANVAEGAGRIVELEAALAGAERSAGMRDEAEKRVRVLSAELESVRAELKQALQSLKQAQTADKTAEEALARAKDDLVNEARQVALLRDEIADVRNGRLSMQADLNQAKQRQQTLCETVRQAVGLLTSGLGEDSGGVVLEVPSAGCAEQTEGHVQTVEVEVLPPRSGDGRPPVVNPVSRAKPGLSLAELEHQARRELERLGSHGKTFFARKK